MHGSQLGGYRWEWVGGHGLTFVKIEKHILIGRCLGFIGN